MPEAHETDAPSLRIHLLDMGTEKYGDCVLVRRGTRTILIDGGHMGDYRRRGESPGLPEQLERILGHPPPFAVDLLVVTHCHSDHIGCLPRLVEDGTLTAKRALVADEKLGFGRALDEPAPDSASSVNRLAAALREEDHSDLSDEELAEFLEDAATVEQRYIGLLDRLTEAGTEIVRYGRDDFRPLEAEFQDFGLQVLGPTRQHLVVCAEAIARFSDQADRALEGSTDAGDERVASLYRMLTRSAADAENEDAEDRPGKGAALNNQSIVLKVQAGHASALLAGDMQFAKAEVSSLSRLMRALRNKVREAGPYKFVKLSHHTSYNGVDESLLDEWPETKAFAHTGGSNDATHPDPAVLSLLEQRSDEIRWARTDRNGLIGVTFTAAGVRFSKSRGRLNDPTPNGDAGAPAVAVRTVAEGPAGDVEVTATARIPAGVKRVVVTFDVERLQAEAGARSPDPARRPARATTLASAPRLASGRTLPSLLFVTDAERLANNIGAREAEAALDAVRQAGQTLLEVRSPGNPYPEVRRKLSGDYAGVVVLGGYDVLPAVRLDVLPPSLRRSLGRVTGDSDNFIVWSDEAYGDRDGDMLPELPVSRIPDGRSPRLMFAALSAGLPNGEGSRFGIRNVARPFAEQVFAALPGSGALLVSEEARPKDVGRGGAAAGHVYVMLHGSDTDGTRFWGEDESGALEALNISNVPKSFQGVVLTGCCWGALISTTTAAQAVPGQPAPPRVPSASLALSWLQAGARAFIGCTGTHYSPTAEPFDYFGGPMHHAFWRRYTQGEAPAAALFRAKLDYLRDIPHGQRSANGWAIELKILKQFTCLGLGW